MTTLKTLLIELGNWGADPSRIAEEEDPPLTAMEQVPRDNDLYMVHGAYHAWTRQQEEDYHQIPNGDLR